MSAIFDPSTPSGNGAFGKKLMRKQFDAQQLRWRRGIYPSLFHSISQRSLRSRDLYSWDYAQIIEHLVSAFGK